KTKKRENGSYDDLKTTTLGATSELTIPKIKPATQYKPISVTNTRKRKPSDASGGNGIIIRFQIANAVARKVPPTTTPAKKPRDILARSPGVVVILKPHQQSLICP